MIKTKIWRDLVILLGIFGGIWLIFSRWNFSIEKLELNHLAADQEEKLGKMIIDGILAEYELSNDSLHLEVIRKIEHRFSQSTDPGLSNYQIRVLIDEEINAFATVGSNIFVFTGLLDFAQRPEEVAAVIAHEIGHVEHQHVVKKLSRDLGITVLVSLLSNGDPNVIMEVTKMMMSTGFSRKYEEEADHFAFDLLARSGLKPSHFATFFLRLKSEGPQLNKHLDIFMSHPDHNSRIENALNYPLSEQFEEIPL